MATLDLDAFMQARPGESTADLLASAVDRARPAWHAYAACRDQDPAIFFPARGGDVRPAKAICAGCPVADPCLDWALDQGFELEGTWAGTSRSSRRRLRAGQAA